MPEKQLVPPVDAKPLLTALEAIRDAGRRRKDAGVDDAAVAYARLAHHTLLWFEKDQKGELEEAIDHLDGAYALINSI